MIKGRQRPFGGGVLAAERLPGCDLAAGHGVAACTPRAIARARVSAASAPICSTASSRLP